MKKKKHQEEEKSPVTKHLLNLNHCIKTKELLKNVNNIVYRNLV